MSILNAIRITEFTLKKIEAIVKTVNFSAIRDELLMMGHLVIDHRNLTTSNVVGKRGGSRVGSSGLQSIPLTKMELVVDDKSAHEVIRVISQKSGLGAESRNKIYISEMTEAVDMDTMEGHVELEPTEKPELEQLEIQPQSTEIKSSVKKPRIRSDGKKSRLVPLQKYTLNRVTEIYDKNTDRLRSEYRIKSFSDFVNFCILGYLPTIEEQLAQKTIMYERRF